MVEWSVGLKWSKVLRVFTFVRYHSPTESSAEVGPDG
jgi:hypothetical protein